MKLLSELFKSFFTHYSGIHLLGIAMVYFTDDNVVHTL